jgi:hypothetical protein
MQSDNGMDVEEMPVNAEAEMKPPLGMSYEIRLS